MDHNSIFNQVQCLEDSLHKQALQEETRLSFSIEHISETANAFKLRKLIRDALLQSQITLHHN